MWMFSRNSPCDNHLISKVVESGIPVFVTEWGTALKKQEYLSEEDLSMEDAVSYQDAALPFLEYMEKHKISWAAWALSNKDEMHSIIRSDCGKYSDWSLEELTDYGRMIFEHFD